MSKYGGIVMKYKSNTEIIHPCLYSCNRIVIEVNKEFIEFTSYMKEELLGKSLIEIGSLIRINSQVSLDNNIGNYSAYIFTKSMNVREVNILHFHVTGTNEEIYTFVEKPNSRIDDKLIKYIFETACEVTESVYGNQALQIKNKIIEEQKEHLEQKNAQLLNIIENLSEGVILSDNKGKFIMVNSQAKRLVYHSDNIVALGEAFKNSKIFDMQGNEIHYENLPGIRALRGEKANNLKAHIKHFDNEFFLDISSIPIYDLFGNLINVISYFHDITDTINQSRKIEEQKKQLEAIIENISDGISIFDDKGKYISFNKSERKMFFPYYEISAQTNERYYIYIYR